MRKDKAVRIAEMKAAVKSTLKSLIAPVIFLLIIVAGVLVITLWKEEEEPEKIIQVNAYAGDTSTMVLENDKLLFEMDPSTTQFTITQKDTGAVWYSNPEGGGSDPAAQTIEKQKLQSTVLLTYSTINGVDTLYNNYKYSMENQIYEIEQGDDYIKINYSIGDVQKEFVIPPVLSEERMDAYLEVLDKNAVLLIGNYYKKYDINNLGKKDNKEELLERYPMMADTVIYAIRDTTKDAVRKKLQEFFAEIGYTYEEYLADKANDKGETTTDKPVFNMSMTYRLDGEDLVVEVPFSDIQYKEEYPVYYLSILPYFGAGTKEEEGFLLVPEGGGGLIEFNNGKIKQNDYFSNLYGWDMAQDREAIVHETETSFNVFGISKEDSSFICIMEDGAPYAGIRADVSGKKHSYNYACAEYTLVHREQYDVAETTTGSIYSYEPGLQQDEKIVQRYRFVGSDNYVDMANAYSNYLSEKYTGYLAMNDDTTAPVALEIIGAVDKIEQVVGVPVSRPLELTTFDEASAIIDELHAAGMTNMSVKLSGWMNGGVQQKLLDDVKVIRGLGGKKDLQAMVNASNEKGVPVYLNGITNYAKDSDVFDGFFVFTDAARFVSKEKAELYVYNEVSYGKRESQDTYYLLKASIILDMAKNLQSAANSYGAGVSFEDMGDVLSSDFKRKELVSRQKVMNNQSELLKSMKDEGTAIMINSGNDYAIAYADMVTNMDLGGYEYTIIDKQVPFYQIALHGMVNYTGEPINLAGEYQEEVLKSAEYGAGLSFTIMDETSFTLQNTLYTEYYGAEYASWKDQMIEIYTRYNNELGHVFNQRMTGHEYVAENVAMTTYEDGTRVYVNYSYDDVTVDGTTVTARDYAVVR
ncbi:MAG: hypothetical protein J6L65_06245 [Lachnospiraceae bacterium]|nr:hypothetical protein [Lachnospiraceae bacterium]